jgi:hypothetical protein
MPRPKPTPRARASALKSAAVKVVSEGDAPLAPAIEAMQVPVALLLAAESIAAKVEKDRTSLRGVMLHQVDPKVGRIVGTDGVRLFVGSYGVGAKPPSWLKTGIMLPSADLKTRVSMIAKVGDTKFVQISHAKGDSHCMLSDPDQTMQFRVECGSVESFPGYQGGLSETSFADLTEDGEANAKPEWTPVGFNSRQLRHCGDLAKILEAGIDKKDRPENGMVIRMFDGGQRNAPTVFDFVGYPGAILVVGALPAVSTAVPMETMAVLAPAVKLTIAALKAHATRNLEWAAEATDEARKAEFTAKADRGHHGTGATARAGCSEEEGSEVGARRAAGGDRGYRGAGGTRGAC